jgi:hypothetical protein
MKITRLAILAALAAAAIAPASAHAGSALNDIAIATESTAYIGVLDTAGSSGAAGAKVVSNPAFNLPSQHWSVLQSPGGVHIVNLRTGLCLTTPGTFGAQLYITYCNDANPRQDWIFGALKLTKWPEFDGGQIRNPYTGLYVNLSGGSNAPGTPIIGWSPNGAEGELFGYYHWS